MSCTEIKYENFQQEVLESEKPVLVEFWAQWCGPCKSMGPMLEKVAEERPDVKVCKINTEEETELTRQYHILGLPTLMLFWKGNLIRREVGARSKEDVLEMITGELEKEVTE